MKENFDDAFEMTVMGYEGGSKMTQDKDDPGGLTKYGLSKLANPDLDIANLTKEEAKSVYRERYWNACDCDTLNPPWDYIMFDTAVNLGVARAKKEKELSSSPEEYHLHRLLWYKILVSRKPNMERYFRGWVNRVLSLWLSTRYK